MLGSFRCWALAFVFVALVAPVRAAEMDRYLPPDTEVVITINVKQILGSELLKKAGLEQWKEALNTLGEVSSVLQDLGLDPFKDLDRITIVSPGGVEQDRGLIIVRGNFNTAKFKAKADESAKSNADELKIHKVPGGKAGHHLVYEVAIPGQNLPLFVAVASKEVILISPGKDYVVDGLKKLTATEANRLQSKDMQGLLEKMDDKQSLSVAGLAAALQKDPNIPEAVKNSLAKLDAIGGGVTVTDEVKLEFVLSAKTVESAKEIDKSTTDALNQGLALVALLAGQKKELAPLIEVLKTIRSSSKGKLVTIKAQVGADIIDKALGKDK